MIVCHSGITLTLPLSRFGARQRRTLCSICHPDPPKADLRGPVETPFAKGTNCISIPLRSPAFHGYTPSRSPYIPPPAHTSTGLSTSGPGLNRPDPTRAGDLPWIPALGAGMTEYVRCPESHPHPSPLPSRAIPEGTRPFPSAARNRDYPGQLVLQYPKTPPSRRPYNPYNSVNELPDIYRMTE